MRLQTVFCCLSLLFSTLSWGRTVLHDEPIVNGHPGYLSAWDVNGPLDKVILIVPGYDTKNNSLPIDELYGDIAPITEFMGSFGWDIVYFDYVDGAIDLKANAGNLARMIEQLDSQADGDYHLAILGGSMGGIVARTMFVQENNDMGVDTYVSLDSPHWGVYLSNWVGDVPAQIIDTKAARQMYNGDPAYKEHYGWLRSVEGTRAFKRKINRPMDTCAITLSDGSQGFWKVSWNDLALHNKYYPVSSYVSYSGLKSTYMPYHSTAYLDSFKLKKKNRGGFNLYRYADHTSSYFDQVIPNKADEHSAPAYAWLEALVFIIEKEAAQ